MMKRLLLVVVLSTMMLPALAGAQEQFQRCSECVLGLWDDEALTTNFGTATPAMAKVIYLGLKLPPTETGINAIEFSVYGMRADVDGIFATLDWMVEPNVELGTFQAPADSSLSSMAMGGVTAAWPACQAATNNQLVLARITIQSFAELSNTVFTIKRKYPPSNPTLGGYNPVLARCDRPVFTQRVIVGNCYVANWDGTTDILCAPKNTAVVPSTWGGVKRLYSNRRKSRRRASPAYPRARWRDYLTRTIERTSAAWPSSARR